MTQHNPQPPWRVNWLKPRFPWLKQAIRPAEISDSLCKAITSRENILEDAEYNKVVPNQFKIELTRQDYESYFKPLEKDLLQQWHDRLLEHLMTLNERLGRIEYRLSGQLQIELCSSPDLQENQARILCYVEPGDKLIEIPPKPSTNVRGTEIAFLELINGDRRWSLYPGNNIIGRDPACDVFLDIPLIQQKRLISAQHAMIRIEGRQSFLLDGAPSGKPSANGTYVNSQPIPPDGVPLKEGDLIILAVLNHHSPRIDTPGVAAFRFHKVPLGAKRA